MPKISFSIMGSPKHQQRHRSSSRGKYVHIYDPSAKDKKDFLLQAKQYAPNSPILGDIKLSVWFCMKRPKIHHGTGKNKGVVKSSAPTYHTKKPDVDNLVKFVMDALNKAFWKDDSQVCSLIAVKLYDQKPRTVIQIDYK